MRRRIKRSSLFTMIAVVALLSLGIGYAAWTSTLTINSTATTASAPEVVWSAFSAIESADPQNAGTCKVGVGETAPATTFSWHIENAYPGYACEITTTAKNTGDLAMIVTHQAFSRDLTRHDDGYFTAAGQPGVRMDFSRCFGPEGPPGPHPATILQPEGEVNCTTVVSFDENTLAGNSTGYHGTSTVKFELYTAPSAP